MSLLTRIWTTPDEAEVIEGEEVSVGFDFITGTPSSPEIKIYQNGTDASATYVPTGSPSVGGTIVASQTIKNLKGGEILIAVCKATVGGQVRKKKLRLVVVFPGDDR